MNKKLLLTLFLGIVLVSLASAVSIDYTSTTPEDNSFVGSNPFSVEVNISDYTNLRQFVLEENQTNTTLYDFSNFVILYNFDNLSQNGDNSTTTYDSISNRSAFIGGGATYSSGKNGQAILINYTNGNKVTVPHDDSLNLVGNATFSFWFSLSEPDTSTEQDLISAHASNYRITYKSNRFRFYHSDDGGSYVYVLSDINTLISNTWYFATIVWDNSTDNVTFYVDGVQKGMVNSPGSLRTNNPSYENYDITIGAYYNGGNPLSGKIDEVAIMNETLNSSQIEKIYNSFITRKGQDYLFKKNYEFDSEDEGNYTFELFVNDSGTTYSSSERNFILQNGIVINFPFSNVIVQKDNETTGRVMVNGTTDLVIDEVTVSSGDIEKNISVSDGEFIGFIDLPKGLNNITISADGNFVEILSVGVGDVILISGQSNAVGEITGAGEIAYSISYPVWMVRRTGTPPTDWTNYTYDQVDGTGKWNELGYYASYYGEQPVMLLNIAVGSAPVTNFIEGGAYYEDSIKLINYFTGGTMKVKGAMWNQGEAGILYDKEEETYFSQLGEMINGFFGALDFINEKWVVAQTLKSSDGLYPDKIRKAQQRSWSEITGSYRGAILYDIQLSPTEVHPETDSQKQHYNQRLSWAGIEQLYADNTYTPSQVTSVVKTGTDTITIYYDKEMELSDWDETAGDISKGYILWGTGLDNLTDSNVTSTTLSSDKKSIEVEFETSVSDYTDISICTNFTCYGEVIARTESNLLPPPIVYDMEISDAPSSLPSGTRTIFTLILIFTIFMILSPIFIFMFKNGEFNLQGMTVKELIISFIIIAVGIAFFIYIAQTLGSI